MLEIKGCYQTRLSDLLLSVNHCIDDDVEVSHIELTLDKLTPGDMWVSRLPETADVRQAEQLGAVAVLCAMKPAGEFSIPVIELAHWQKDMGVLLTEFYESPSAQMHVMAVTGTNGKTSIAYLYSRAVQVLAVKSGYIGSLGWGIPGDLEQTKLTTPGVVDLQRMLADLRDRSVDFVSLEASSHGLDQGRLNGAMIDVAIFTNLTHEHMNYHRNINAYLAAKKILFEMPTVSKSIINIDDPSGEYLSTQLQSGIWACSMQGYPKAHKMWSFAATESFGLEGQEVSIMTHSDQVRIRTKLIGAFNASNLMLAHAALCIAGFDAGLAAQALSSVHEIPGRLMPLRYQGLKPRVLVDYAHSPDAMRHVLSALKGTPEGKLKIIFGCGGGGDEAKRSQMGRVAESYADEVYITQDNSRGESFSDICDEILKGMHCPSLAMINPCRYATIEQVISASDFKDVVLIAGMGDTKSYILSMQAYMSDVEILEDILHG